MNGCSVSSARAAVRERCAAGVGLIVCAVLVFVAGGCAGPKVVELTDVSDVAAEIQDTSGPLMVDFYKEGCWACVMMEGPYSQLADEYDGRVRFIRHKLLNLIFMASSVEMQERYKVVLYPTVILFVNGVERRRWMADYDVTHYYEALTEAAGPPEKKTPPPKDEPTQAKAGHDAARS